MYQCTGTFHIVYLPARVIKYADDFTVCVPVYRSGKNEHVLAAHKALLSWSEETGLPLNLEKCKTLAVPRTADFRPVILPNVSTRNK